MNIDGPASNPLADYAFLTDKDFLPFTEIPPLKLHQKIFGQRG